MNSTQVKNLIYGLNDGLTANFGLMAGIVGAQVTDKVVLMAALSGALANSLSMASSSYLASKSEKEVKAYNDDVIHDNNVTAFQEGYLTGGATLIGSLVPMTPYLFLRGIPAIYTSFVVAMVAHFLVGALRSKYTGKNFWTSGFEMLIVGFGVAGIGYLIGEQIGYLF